MVAFSSRELSTRNNQQNENYNYDEDKNIILIKVISGSNNYINNAYSELINTSGPDGEMKIKIHFPNNFSNSCDYMFYFKTNVKEIIYKNFSGCTSSYRMFYLA